MVQSYDIILKVVSVAYGKNANKGKIKIAKDQRVIKSRAQHPMEKISTKSQYPHVHALYLLMLNLNPRLIDGASGCSL